jgi:hypothetical protein
VSFAYIRKTIRGTTACGYGSTSINPRQNNNTMNKQEPTAKQEEPEYRVLYTQFGHEVVVNAKGMVFKTMQDCADELNELVRQRDTVISKERDAARVDAVRGDMLLEEIGEILDSAGIPDLRPREMLLGGRVRWAIKERDEARAEAKKLRYFFAKYDIGIQQELGKSLGYPWYKDDQKNFQCATESNGVCVGDHTGGTLAAEAASKIRELRAEVEKLKEQLRAEIKKNTITIPIRPEPSRLEIAAHILCAWEGREVMTITNVDAACKTVLSMADTLITAAKEEQ